MPGFAAPEFLLLVPLFLVVLAWFERRAKPGIVFSDLTLFDGMPRGRTWWTDLIRRGLRTLAIVSGVVALAGPRIPDWRTRLPADGIAIVFAIDISTSMGESDFTDVPNGSTISRISAAKLATTQFIRGGDDQTGQMHAGRPTDSLGLVAFAAWPEAVCPLTLNHSVLVASLDKLVPKSGIDAGTNIGDSIAESLIRLEAAGTRRKVLILLTDGEHNISLTRADPPLKPRQAAQLAHDLQIPIYAIDCGGHPQGDAETVQRRMDGQRTLQTIAKMTGGKSFMANNRHEMQTVYAEIERLERSTTESFTYRRYRDLSPWLAGVALVCVFIQWLLDTIVWRVLSNETA